MNFEFNPFTGRFDAVGGSTSVSGATIITDTIAPATTKTVDTLLLSSFRFAEYSVRISKVGFQTGRFFKFAVNNETANLSDTLYSIIGPWLDVIVEADIQTSSLVLKITNNEAVAIDFKARRVDAN